MVTAAGGAGRLAWTVRVLVVSLAAASVACGRSVAEPPSPPVAEVVEEIGRGRFTRPWLTAFGEHAPCGESRRAEPRGGGPFCGPWSLAPAGRPAEVLPASTMRGPGSSRSRFAGTPEDLHAEALRRLHLRDADGAVRLLEEARDRAPSDWRVRSDLGASYLLQGLGGDPIELLAALDELDQAGREAPARPPIRFNRSLALQELGLVADAERAWADFLDLGPPPAWREEARAARAAARRAAVDPSLGDFEAELRLALAVPGDLALRRRVAGSPQDALRFAEMELLAAWSREMLAGDDGTAGARLAEAERLGRILQAVTGDSFVAATAADATTLREPGERIELAHALARYLGGREAYEARDLGRAERTLRAAAGSVAGPRERPLALWIDFYLALCEYWKGAPQVQEEMTALGRRAEGAGLPILRGYVAWTSGLVHVEAGRLGAGFAEYDRALELFQAAGLLDAAGTVRVLRSDALVRVGQVEEGWSEAWKAVSQADGFRDPRHLSAAWDQAAHVVAALGRPRLAPYFHRSALAAARRASSPLTPVTAAVASATAWNRLGEWEAARRELAEARRWARRISDPAVRQRSDAAILTAESRATEPGGEAAALIRLTGAIRRYEAIAADVVLAGLYLERARLHLALGRSEEGERDLRRALRLMEIERRSIDDVEWRVSYSSTTRAALDLLIIHHLDVSGDLEAIPALTDLARDPAYFAPLAPGVTRDLLGPGYHRRLVLAPGEALLSATVLEDRLVLWLARDGDLAVAVAEVSQDELARRLSAVEVDVGSEHLAWFYDHLIRPLDARLDGVERLFVALDRGLHRLPMAGFLDRTTGQRVVARFSLVVVPAAIVLARTDTPRAPVAVERLAVAGASAAPGLPRLLEVADEVAALRGLYPRSRELREVSYPADLEAGGAWGDVLHFAGHAVSNPLVPSLSRLAFDSGSIYAGDLRRLRLKRARTVFLASCETAVTDPRDSSGALSLAVAFLEAGADWVVASIWPVEDEAARRFSERFHRELVRDGVPDQALRRAQLHFMEESPTDRTRDWAAYQVVAR